MKINVPSAIGGVLQAIKPLTIIDGAPMAVSAVSASTTASVGSEAVVIYADTWVHVRLSTTGVAATVNDYIIPADSERVLHCNVADRVSAVKMAGKADGTIWCWPCANIP